MDAGLCDCFLEYGETTAEMALLFAFVLFGTSIIWGGLTVISGATILFTVAAIVLRPVAYFPALLPAALSTKNRALIAFFGPTGLSSLLLVMPPAPKGKISLAVREVPDDRPHANTITLDEYQQLKATGSVVLVDSRSERTFAETEPVP